MEEIKFTMENAMLYDRLLTLSVEYDLPMEMLVHLAIKKLLDDVEFVRSLRTGTVKLE